MLIFSIYSGLEVIFITGKYTVYEGDDNQVYLNRFIALYQNQPVITLSSCLIIKFLSLFYIVYFWIKHFQLIKITWSEASIAYTSLNIIFLILTLILVLLLEYLPQNLNGIYVNNIIPFFSRTIYIGLKIFQLPSKILISTFSVFKIPLLNLKLEYAGFDIEKLLQKHQLNSNENDKSDVDTELFENVLVLKKLRVRECMVPRNEITAVEIDDEVEILKEKIIETNHSRVLVYKESIDNIIGYVHHFDLHKHPEKIEEILIPIKVIPETMSVQTLMNDLISENKNIAWVVNEYGGTAGVVTLEDILEEIFGEIDDEFDNDGYIENQLSENEFILSGRLEIDRVNEDYDLDIPEGDYETLSGMIVSYIGSIPKESEQVKIGKYNIKILSVSETKIETIKLTKEDIEKIEE